MTAQAQLYRQIEYSLFKIDTMRDQVINLNEFDKFYFVEHLIYDAEWHKHLAVLLDDISVEYQDTIVLWFDSLYRLILRAKMRNGLVSGTELIGFYGEVSWIREDLHDVLKYMVSLRSEGIS